jgi:NAD(P)-dependent dehydrogenase (short-subunit alcohol dehydrogenase family)
VLKRVQCKLICKDPGIDKDLNNDLEHRGSADIGPQILNGAAKIFSDGDISKLKVHILVHNAAMGHAAILEKQTMEDFDAIFNVNGEFYFLSLLNL